MKVINFLNSNYNTLDKSQNLKEQSQLGAMPEWDLSDLYSSASAKEIVKDLKSVEQLSESFASKYEKKLSTLSATENANLFKISRKNYWINGAFNVVCRS